MENIQRKHFEYDGESYFNILRHATFNLKRLPDKTLSERALLLRLEKDIPLIEYFSSKYKTTITKVEISGFQRKD